MAPEDAQPRTELGRGVGLGAACFLILGNVIGASIFILPGKLAAAAGPGVFLSYGIAALLSLVGLPILAIVGTAFRTSGAVYVSVQTTLGSDWGFVVIWSYIVALTLGVAFVASGFAYYLGFLFPTWSPTATALGLVLVVGAVNLAGVQTSVWFQALLVLWFAGTLAIFGIIGFVTRDSVLLDPLVPAGWAPVLVAVIPAYFAFLGMNTVVDIAEEVHEPKRTIPLSLAISFLVILAAYTLVPLGIAGHIPWRELASVDAPVAEASLHFLPSWFGTVVAYAALAAAATSAHAAVLAGSRAVLAAARDGLLPPLLGHLHARTQIPVFSVLLLSGLAGLGISLGATVQQYASLAVLAAMIIFSLLAVALLRIPQAAPEAWAHASLRPGRGGRVALAAGEISVCVFFLLMTARDDLGAVVALIIVLAVGLGAHALAHKRLPFATS